MKIVTLANGRETVVDDDIFEWMKQWKWRANTNLQYVYRYRSKKEGTKKKCCYLHREITSAKDGQFVDHIDGNPLNNQRGNLRICTKTQNSCNQKKTRGSSKYKGVSIVRRLKIKKWKVQICLFGKRISGGYFSTEDEAAEAYNKLAASLFGEYARLNVIDRFTVTK